MTGKPCGCRGACSCAEAASRPRWRRPHEVTVPGLYLWRHDKHAYGDAVLVWVETGSVDDGGFTFHRTQPGSPVHPMRSVTGVRAQFYGPIPTPDYASAPGG